MNPFLFHSIQSFEIKRTDENFVDSTLSGFKDEAAVPPAAVLLAAVAAVGPAAAAAAEEAAAASPLSGESNGASRHVRSIESESSEASSESSDEGTPPCPPPGGPVGVAEEAAEAEEERLLEITISPSSLVLTSNELPLVALVVDLFSIAEDDDVIDG